MKRPTITAIHDCGVQRDGARYWESVHKGVYEAQQAAQALAKKRKKTFSVYKWNEGKKAALFVSAHMPLVEL